MPSFIVTMQQKTRAVGLDPATVPLVMLSVQAPDAQSAERQIHLLFPGYNTTTRLSPADWLKERWKLLGAGLGITVLIVFGWIWTAMTLAYDSAVSSLETHFHYSENVQKKLASINEGIGKMESMQEQATDQIKKIKEAATLTNKLDAGVVRDVLTAIDKYFTENPKSTAVAISSAATKLLDVMDVVTTSNGTVLAIKANQLTLGECGRPAAYFWIDSDGSLWLRSGNNINLLPQLNHPVITRTYFSGSRMEQTTLHQYDPERGQDRPFLTQDCK